MSRSTRTGTGCPTAPWLKRSDMPSSSAQADYMVVLTPLPSFFTFLFLFFFSSFSIFIRSISIANLKFTGLLVRAYPNHTWEKERFETSNKRALQKLLKEVLTQIFTGCGMSMGAVRGMRGMCGLRGMRTVCDERTHRELI